MNNFSKDYFLIMTLLVRNEEDILKENIEFHLNQGVDHIIATNNLSTDGTTQILEDFKKEGYLTLINEQSDVYAQSIWVTKMARMAYKEFNSKWVINNDADEFWLAKNKNLKSFFQSLSKENIVIGERKDMICILDDKKDKSPFYERMIYRKNFSVNSLGKKLPVKVAHRAMPYVKVCQGNHRVKNNFPFFEKKATEKLEILHYPIRSEEQFNQKIMLGGAAYERNKELTKNVGKTWRIMYKELLEKKEIKFCKENIYSKYDLEKLINNGEVEKDLRVFNYLKEIKAKLN